MVRRGERAVSQLVTSGSQAVCAPEFGLPTSRDVAPPKEFFPFYQGIIDKYCIYLRCTADILMYVYVV